jgi:SHAQKYF class myb-like DNA-binding protein
MDLHVDSLHVDPFGFNRDSHHHHHLLPDFPNDDSPQFNDPLSPKHSLKDLDESLHSKPLFHSQHNELLDDFMAPPGSPSSVGSPSIRESDEPHNLDLAASAGTEQNGISLSQIAIPIALPPGGTTVIDGVTYNNRGYEVCGALNKFNKPCQRIGRCPFHPDHKKADPPPPIPVATEGPAPIPEPRRFLPIKKGPYKSGWKKDEHLRFLKGLQIHGRGSWKDIALIVGTRTPTQIQVHAHRYYLRQQQGTKNKRSIHDISLEDLEELEVQHGSIMQPNPHSPLPQLSPPSPENSDHNSHDLSHLFHHNSYSHHNSVNNNSNHTSHLHSPPSSPISHIHSTTSSTNFPPLFPSGTTNTNTLPGLLPLQLPMPGSSAPFSMNYHSSSSWFNPSPYSIPPMNIGDDNLAGLHLPPPSDHKLLSPLHNPFSHDDYEDDDELTDSDFNVSHAHLSNVHNEQNDDEEDNGDE